MRPSRLRRYDNPLDYIVPGDFVEKEVIAAHDIDGHGEFYIQKGDTLTLETTPNDQQRLLHGRYLVMFDPVLGKDYHEKE